MSTVTGAAMRPRRGRARVKVDLSYASRWTVADLLPLFRTLGLPTDVGIGQDFRGILHGRPSFVEPERMAYVEGRLRLTLPELYAVRHGYDRAQLTGTVEALWFDRLRFDAGRLDLPRLQRVYRRWQAPKALDLSDGQRRVLDSVVLFDALHRRADWKDDTPDEVGMMLAERFLGPWASEPRPDRHISPATARRRRDELLRLGLLMEVDPPEGLAAQGGRRPPRYFRLGITSAELR